MATNLILDSDRLPEDVEKGAEGGPRFQTLIQTQRSGREVRIPVWSQVRAEWDISWGLRDLATDDALIALDNIIAIFYAAQGRAAAFLFKDWSDFKIGDPDNPGGDHVIIGTGDAVLTVFQIYKRYILPSAAFHDRKISRIVTGTLSVYVDDVLQVNPTHYTVDLGTGLITFVSAPADTLVVAVACEFDVLVRFDSDHLPIAMESFEAGQISPIKIVEVKE